MPSDKLPRTFPNEPQPPRTPRIPFADVAIPTFRSSLLQAVLLPSYRRKESGPVEPPSMIPRPRPWLYRGICFPIARHGTRDPLPTQPISQSLVCLHCSYAENGRQSVGQRNPRTIAVEKKL